MLGIGILVYFFGPLIIKAALYLFSLLSPFVFGYIFSKLINPIADRLQRRLKIPRGVSTVMVIIFTLAVLVGLIGVVGYKLFDEIKNLYHQWPVIVESVSSAWQNFSAKWSNLYIDLPDSFQNALDTLRESIETQVSEFMSDMELVNNAQSAAKSLPGGLIWTVIFILSMYFMVSQKEQLNQSISKYLGNRFSNKLDDIKQECKKYLGGYVKAQIILMFIVMLIIAVVLAILQAPFSLLIAAVTAILDALPVFGSGIILWPLAIVYFISGNLKLGIGYVALYLAVMLVRRMIEPKLVSDRMGFNPILTLISMYAGYRWWGIIGMLIGPILLMAVMSIYKVGLFDKLLQIFKQLFGFIIKEIRLFINYLDTITK